MQGHGHVYYRYLLPLLQLLREQCGQCSPDGFPDIVGFRLSLALGRAGAISCLLSAEMNCIVTSVASFMPLFREPLSP